MQKLTAAKEPLTCALCCQKFGLSSGIKRRIT